MELAPNKRKASSRKPVRLADVAKKAQTWNQLYERMLPYNEPSDQRAGLMFEEFCRAYFLAVPGVRREFKHVWHHSRLPPKVRRKLTINRRDHGVDLLLQHQDGRYFAVQCKFKSDERLKLSWTKDRLASWLSEADECQGLILFTNASGVDAHTTTKCRKKDFRLFTLADLLTVDQHGLGDILRIAKGQKPKARPRATPRQYQAKAIRDVTKGLKSNERGQLILPCGAGKTLTALWIRERLKSRRTLLLVPSLALLRQTKKEWTAHEKIWTPYLCVCSEWGIDSAAENDSTIAHTYDVQGTVTTSPKVIGAFLRRHSKCVIYATYQSLAKLSQATRSSNLRFDLVICDEAHKTAGDRKGEFARIHDERKIRGKRRLYMTATPRVTSQKLKDTLGEEHFKLLADMGDPAVFGPVFHRMTFGAAIDRGILADYRIIVMGVSDKEMRKAVQYRRYAAGTTLDEIANNIALEKVMRKYQASHAITFHSSVKRAREFQERHKDYYPRLWSSHVNGAMSTRDREVFLNEFRAEEKAVLTNARCLTEGIDVPAIDCVYFCDPKSSKVDIVQASGRALRKGKRRKDALGYIVVPVFHRERKDVEKAIVRSVFRNVVAVVRALADQDERIEAEIHALVVAKGSRRGGEQRIRVDLGQERVTLVGFEKTLRRALFDQIVRKSTTTWEARILELVEYKRQFGHMRVPQATKGRWAELGRWVHEVRKQKRWEMLPTRRIQELESLGFSWWVDGQTIDDTTGLLTENEILQRTGISVIRTYRIQGRIQPVGYAPTSGNKGLGAYYAPEQVEEMKKLLGVTLDDTSGLIPEKAFQKATGLWSLPKYRRDGLIVPVGNGIDPKSKKCVSFYRPSQEKELRKKLGATLKDTHGLLSESAVASACGMDSVARYRKNGALIPFGFAITRAGISAFYKPHQVDEFKRKLGITLKTTDGLLTEKRIRRDHGFETIAKYRQRGLITPVGYGIAPGAGVVPYYHPSQLEPLRRKLGQTLRTTNGLLVEAEFGKAAGFANVGRYRKKGVIKPRGFAITHGGLSAFYHHSQIGELKKNLGITLDDTSGLISENQVRTQVAGLRRIKEYRKAGRIKPIGVGMATGGVSVYYHPEQLEKLKRELGITLDDAEGLLSEDEFRKFSGLTNVRRYRKRGLIEPFGYAPSVPRVAAFYQPKQAAELRKKLGITLASTEGLLPEKEAAKVAGVPSLRRLRLNGLVKPAGFALSGSGLAAFYRSSQIGELKRAARAAT